MYHKIFEGIEYSDVTLLFIGIVLSAFSTIFIIRFFRPKIYIGIPIKENNILKINVENKSKYFSAANIRIEAATVLNNQTYHLNFDRIDFIMLSPQKTTNNLESPYKRIFQASEIDNHTKKIAINCQNMEDFFNLLSNNQSYLRIRIHAYHEFTGFGKAFQSKFNYNNDIFTHRNE